MGRAACEERVKLISSLMLDLCLRYRDTIISTPERSFFSTFDDVNFFWLCSKWLLPKVSASNWPIENMIWDNFLSFYDRKSIITHTHTKKNAYQNKTLKEEVFPKPWLMRFILSSSPRLSCWKTADGELASEALRRSSRAGLGLSLGTTGCRKCMWITARTLVDTTFKIHHTRAWEETGRSTGPVIITVIETVRPAGEGVME